MCSVTAAPDFYELLGLARTCSKEEVHLAFRSVSKRTHPDAGGNAGLFRMVTVAYATLSDPAKRSVYDSGLAAEDESLRALAAREAAVTARELLVSEPAVTHPVETFEPSTASPVPQRRVFLANLSAHWHGWVRCILAAALGPLFWVALQYVDVAGLVGLEPSSVFLYEKLSWLLGPPPRLRVVLVLCCLTGWAAWRLRVYLVVRPWVSSLRWAVAGVWFALGYFLPYLPDPVALVSLCAAGVVAVVLGALWSRFVRS